MTVPTMNPRVVSNSLGLNPLQTKRASFKNDMSPLNPLAKPKVVALSSTVANGNVRTTVSNVSTRQHLSNLERLLQKPGPSAEVGNGVVVEERREKGILEGLDFAGIWRQQEAEAAEEVQLHYLNGLQRLLSTTPEYSPRNGLGGRWREYHGCNNWAGLLDPLDENLRREVVRYGEFVQAAYHAFHASPAMSAGEGGGGGTSSSSSSSRHVPLLDGSYRVTRSLYATSSVGLPRWVDDMAPDLGWLTQRSSWIGYVAVCDDRREIQRMGRRDIVIALRGTATCLEWAENLRANLVPIPNMDHGRDSNTIPRGQPEVECGFLSMYRTSGDHVPSLAETIVQEVKRLIELYKDETLSITVTGHSLGAALALLVADELRTVTSDTTSRRGPAPPVAVFSFGGPKVGNKEFGDRIDEKNVKVLRIVNNQDIITKVPGIEGMPWDCYSHVGTELRVDTKMSPYLKPDADVACCHDLEAYLHLVDGFLSSNCPFRANAKRSLVKLINEQKSNVKRLYTSKVKGLDPESPGKGRPRSSSNVLVQ